jgi:hypothetical protein
MKNLETKTINSNHYVSLKHKHFKASIKEVKWENPTLFNAQWSLLANLRESYGFQDIQSSWESQS